MIEVKNISKSFGDISVLNNINFTIDEGQSFAIIGESGRGKTSLLYLLSGLDNADSGSITIFGEDITKFDEKKSSIFRAKHFGFIFQHHFLLNDLDALENALLPLRVTNSLHKKNEVLELFEYFGLQDRLSHFPDELSGGEKQRVAFIRALANNPDIVFADEPTGSLDKKNADKLQELLLSKSKTLVVSTHNLDFAKQCDCCYTIDELES